HSQARSLALIRAARAGHRPLGRVVQPAPAPQLYRGCATSRVRVDLLSGARGVSRCVKTKPGSLQETQGDSPPDHASSFEFFNGKAAYVCVTPTVVSRPPLISMRSIRASSLHDPRRRAVWHF